MSADTGAMQWLQGDPSSHARPEEAAVTAVDLQLRVDFEKKVLHGEVELTVERRDKAARQVVLDTRDLEIATVTSVDTGAALDWQLGEEAAGGLGRPMTVQLPTGGEAVKIRIQYQTVPSCTALAWLDAAQTAGRRQPYVFSQNQAVHCRSMIPIQDTPAVKLTYTARVTVPTGLTALMSALRDGQEPTADGVTFKFRQPVPMPAYLIALAVGELESRKLGPRSHVWSEPETVDQSAYEFADTEKFLKTAESICGEYVWDQYDLLVLPPSFPFGGMENPCLTFVTPTLLAGDRSLADVVVHEITHSWTGNLVTNRNWEHFWLNEGFTMFIQRKIEGRLHGEPTRHLSAINGWKGLKEGIKTLGATNPLTNLVVQLKGIDPDDAFSVIPYEKGHTFLWFLEQMVGGAAEFEPFLKAYITKFKYAILDTEDFRTFLIDYFAGKDGVFDKVDWDVWFNSPGMPPYEPKFDTTLADVSHALASRWVTWNPDAGPSPFTAADLEPLSSDQIVEFLGQLLQETTPLSIAKLKAMETAYGMNARNNCEVRFRWLRLGLAGRWREQVPAALKMVTEQGRMKYVRPIYRDLYAWEAVREEAIETYRKSKSAMMYVAAHGVAQDLHLEK